MKIEIGDPVTRPQIPPKKKGANGDKYAEVWQAVDALTKGAWLPVTVERPTIAIGLVQTARSRGYLATQRGCTVYVSKDR